MIRILLVDDQNIIRQGLQALLEPIPKLQVIGTAADGNGAIKQVEHLQPDVVLLDIEMPKMNGITATDKIHRQFPQTKVLVLSSHEDRKYVEEALRVGASGYLLKNTSAKELERAIWSVYQGHSQIETKLLKKVLAKEPVSPPTESIHSELESKPQLERFSKLGKYSIWGVIIVAILSVMGITLIRFLNRPQPKLNYTSEPVQTKPPEIKPIVTTGIIKPLGDTVFLSAPSSLEAVQVEQLFVQVGDRVKKDRIIATVDGRQKRQAALDKAKTRSAAALTHLEKVKAEVKREAMRAKETAIADLESELAGETQTQQATVARLVSELDNARVQWQQYQQLFDEGAISTSELDSKKSTLETFRERLNEAKGTFERTKLTLSERLAEARAALEKTAEVDPVDVQIAQAELEQARSAEAKAESDLELAYVRAPIDGEILDIHTRPGETPNEKGIVEIGQTDRMMIVSEIDRNDMARVKIGEKVTVISSAFPELHGKIHQVGSLTNKNDIIESDPAVVKVEIILEPKDSQKVAKLSNREIDTILKL